MKHYMPEIVITTFLILLAALLWNPYWMPMGAVYAVLTGFIVLLGCFIGFVWREKGGDEREIFIRQIASRIAHLSGTLVFAVGIIYQSLVSHVVDAWLIAGFMIIMLAKAMGYIYGRARY